MMRHSASKRSITVGRALALLPVSLLAVMGCAQIIGLDGYTVASGGSGGDVSGGGSAGTANGGSGARAGSTGSAGKGGSSGSTNIAGTGGEAGVAEAGAPGQGGTGTAGTAGTGTGGTAGAGPTLSCDGSTPILLTQATQDVLAACLYRSACSPFIPARTISKCLTNNTPDAFAGEHCHVGSCADFQNCEHVGIPGDDICTAAKAGTEFCLGNKRVSCDATDPNLNLFQDCVALGATGCGTYTDAMGVHSACTLTGATTSCVGQDANTKDICSTESPALYDYQCIGGTAYGTKCGSFADCELGADRTNSCFFQGIGCTTTACSADKKIATACSGSTGYQYNCGSVGLTCAISTTAQADGDTNYCLAPGCKPADVNNCTESCDGSLLNLCYGGAQITVDCVDYGFATCDTFSDSSNNVFTTCIN